MNRMLYLVVAILAVIGVAILSFAGPPKGWALTQSVQWTVAAASASNCSATPPAPAARAGYTTLAYCLDGADPQYANVVNWLQCYWGQTPANATQHWFANAPGAYFTDGCVSGQKWTQGIDPQTGKMTLIFTWLNASDTNTGQTNIYAMTTNGGSGNCRSGVTCASPPTTDQLQWLTFPQGHYTTIRFRETPLNQTDWAIGCCAPDYYEWGAAEEYNAYFGIPNPSLALEHDHVESAIGTALLDGAPGGTNGGYDYASAAAWAVNATTIPINVPCSAASTSPGDPTLYTDPNSTQVGQITGCTNGSPAILTLSSGAAVAGTNGQHLFTFPYALHGWLAGNWSGGMLLYQYNFPTEAGLFQNQHDYGEMVTMDTGNSQLQTCWYWDHALIQIPPQYVPYWNQCATPSAVRTGVGSGSDFTNRVSLNVWLGGGMGKADPRCATQPNLGDSSMVNGDANLTCAQSSNDFSANTITYIEHIEVWSCPNWNTYNTQQGFDSQPPCSLGIKS